MLKFIKNFENFLVDNGILRKHNILKFNPDNPNNLFDFKYHIVQILSKRANKSITYISFTY